MVCCYDARVSSCYRYQWSSGGFRIGEPPGGSYYLEQGSLAARAARHLGVVAAAVRWLRSCYDGRVFVGQLLQSRDRSRGDPVDGENAAGILPWWQRTYSHDRRLPVNALSSCE